MAEKILLTDYQEAKTAVTNLYNAIAQDVTISWSWTNNDGNNTDVSSLVNPSTSTQIKADAVNALNVAIETINKQGWTALFDCAAHDFSNYSGEYEAHYGGTNSSNWGSYYRTAYSRYYGYNRTHWNGWCSSRQTSYWSVFRSGTSY